MIHAVEWGPGLENRVNSKKAGVKCQSLTRTPSFLTPIPPTILGYWSQIDPRKDLGWIIGSITDLLRHRLDLWVIKTLCP